MSPHCCSHSLLHLLNQYNHISCWQQLSLSRNTTYFVKTHKFVTMFTVTTHSTRYWTILSYSIYYILLSFLIYLWSSFRSSWRSMKIFFIDAVTETLVLFLVSKFFISASFLIIYPFAGELYPTQLRGIGIGMSAYVAGLGLILIPFVTYLVSSLLVFSLES